MTTTPTPILINAPAGRTLVLTRIFNAPRQLVFEAWTKKEHLDRWSCPSGFIMPESHGDLRVGGEFGFTMIAPNGEKHIATGVYREIVPDELLVMTHGWLEDDGTRPFETVITVRFADEGKGKTRMTFEQGVFKSEESRDGHNGGWNQCFDKLGQLLADPDFDSDFVITREFAAPRELLWKVWTEPGHMTNWWGPQGFSNPVCELDVRVGGAYRLVMRSPRGDLYPCKGFYREVVKPERLVMSMDLSEHPDGWFDMIRPDRDKTKKPALDCMMTVIFEEIDGRTKLTIRTRFESMTIRDAMVKAGMNEGWSESLDRMAGVVSKETQN